MFVVYNILFIDVNTSFVQRGETPWGEGILVLILFCNNINIMLLSLVLILLLLFEVALEERH